MALGDLGASISSINARDSRMTGSEEVPEATLQYSHYLILETAFDIKHTFHYGLEASFLLSGMCWLGWFSLVDKSKCQRQVVCVWGWVGSLSSTEFVAATLTTQLSQY